MEFVFILHVNYISILVGLHNIMQCRGFRLFGRGGGGRVWAIFEISKGVEEFSGSTGMRICGGLENFQDPRGDDLCRTMTFSRGVQTPDDTMR